MVATAALPARGGAIGKGRRGTCEDGGRKMAEEVKEWKEKERDEEEAKEEATEVRRGGEGGEGNERRRRRNKHKAQREREREREREEGSGREREREKERKKARKTSTRQGGIAKFLTDLMLRIEFAQPLRHAVLFTGLGHQRQPFGHHPDEGA